MTTNLLGESPDYDDNFFRDFISDHTKNELNIRYGYDRDDDEVTTLANEMVGNWQKFGSFVWNNSNIKNADVVCIWNLFHRDSDYLTVANARAIMGYLADEMERDIDLGYDSSMIWTERHSHSMVGSMYALCVRVFDHNGKITDEFVKLARCLVSMEDYPILCEDTIYMTQDEEVPDYE